MGNVGQHYYEWRYGGDTAGSEPTAEPTEDPYPAP
jgi:hypothetical protein